MGELITQNSLFGHKVLYEEKSNNSTLTSHRTLCVFRSHQLYNNSFHPEDDDVKLPNPDSDRSSRSYTKFNCYLNYTSIKRLTEIKIFFVSPSSSSTEQASKHTYIHTHTYRLILSSCTFWFYLNHHANPTPTPRREKGESTINRALRQHQYNPDADGLISSPNHGVSANLSSQDLIRMVGLD